jgi:ribosomal protein L44E
LKAEVLGGVGDGNTCKVLPAECTGQPESPGPFPSAVSSVLPLCTKNHCPSHRVLQTQKGTEEYFKQAMREREREREQVGKGVPVITILKEKRNTKSTHLAH